MTIDAQSAAECRDLLDRIAFLAAAVERDAEQAGDALPECLKDAVWSAIAQAEAALDP